MVRLRQNNGYTLLEMMVVLSVLAMMLLLTVPVGRHIPDKPIEMSFNDMVMCQFRAIVDCEKVEYEENDLYFYFNRKGGVNMANTYDIHGIEFVVSLGTGRIYVPK